MGHRQERRRKKKRSIERFQKRKCSSINGQGGSCIFSNEFRSIFDQSHTGKDKGEEGKFQKRKKKGVGTKSIGKASESLKIRKA